MRARALVIFEDAVGFRLTASTALSLPRWATTLWKAAAEVVSPEEREALRAEVALPAMLRATATGFAFVPASLRTSAAELG